MNLNTPKWDHQRYLGVLREVGTELGTDTEKGRNFQTWVSLQERGINLAIQYGFPAESGHQVALQCKSIHEVEQQLARLSTKVYHHV